jgi:hypothetical protein
MRDIGEKLSGRCAGIAGNKRQAAVAALTRLHVPFQQGMVDHA